MNKQIWNLTQSDLEKYPVWYFPMIEDRFSDEATVSPASDSEAIDPNTQVVVCADFEDADGCTYIGYIYWQPGDQLEHAQPAMFVGGQAVNFWFGITQPEKSELVKLAFPIVAVSRKVYDLEPKTIKIPGYGYLNKEFNQCHISS